jgi:co-chaperonin GroES (HSP10)
VSWRAYGGYVVVAKDEIQTMTSGGIHIPEEHRKRKCMGTVLSVGHGRVYEDGIFRSHWVKPGDRVVWDYIGAHEYPGDNDKAIVSGEYILLGWENAEAAA